MGISLEIEKIYIFSACILRGPEFLRVVKHGIDKNPGLPGVQLIPGTLVMLSLQR